MVKRAVSQTRGRDASFLTDPSPWAASWRTAITRHLVEKARRQAVAQQQAQERRQALGYFQSIPIRDPTPVEITNWRQIAPALWQQLDVCSLPHSRALDRKLLAFLEQRRLPDGKCLPFGYAWTHFQQMLLLPEDAASALQAFVLRRWRERCACFWFDGQQLAPCSVELLEAVTASRR